MLHFVAVPHTLLAGAKVFSPYRIQDYTLSLFVLNVFNFGHPAESYCTLGYVGGSPTPHKDILW